MATLAEAQALVVKHYQAGDFRQAEMVCRQILQAQPSNTDTLHMLGVIALAAGRPDVSEQYIRQSLAIVPTNALYHCNLGMTLIVMDKLDGAYAAYERAAQLDPQSAAAHAGLASVLRLRGDIAQAQSHLTTALRINPNLADSWMLQGHLFQMQGRLEEAATHFRHAIRLDPRHNQAINNLACTLQLLGRKSEALETYRQALALAPHSPEAHSNIAVVLQEQGKLDEAETHLRNAIRLRPKMINAMDNLGGVMQSQGRLSEALACFREVQALAPQNSSAASNLLLCMNYVPTSDPAPLVAEHVRWGQRFGQAANPGPAPDHDRTPNRRLRVGYVSPDLRDHAIAYFLEPLLKHHHRDQVEIFCYAEVSAPDAVTERLKQLASGWRSSVGLGDAAMADLIRSDKIDILVDLAGHTSGHRLKVFAHKPAPVQATWLGYPNTTGVAAIDYRLTDAIADPPGEASGYTEELFRLPRAFCCFRSPSGVPEVSALPAERTGFITFGSLHTLPRLNQQVLETWCAILRALPTARLLILRHTLSGNVRNQLQQFFTSQGIAADRVDLLSRMQNPGGFLSAYHRIDISLDTFPWSGHTTSCQSLWMGVPVITLRGNRFAGRMVSSVLHHIGLPHLIAETREHYVELAVKLAADIPSLARLRAGLRQQMAASALCDGDGFARDVEDAYRQMWVRWCGR